MADIDRLSKPKNDPRGDGRSFELTQNALNTVAHLEGHFKRARRRDTAFSTQKLVNSEKETRAKERLGMVGQIDTRATFRPSESSQGASRAVLARSQSTPALARWPALPPRHEALYPVHGSPGQAATHPACIHRFAATVPTSNHPPAHPGATYISPCARTTPAFPAFPRSGGASDSFFLTESLSSPALKAPHNSWSGEFDDDVFSAEAVAPSRRLEVKHPPEAISKLGDLMALLGPRYKTLSRQKLWEQAKNTETPLQMRLRHSRDLDFSASGKIRGASRGRREPDDPDGKARAAWLASRVEERAQAARRG